MTERIEVVFEDDLADEIEAFAAEHDIETPMETIIQLVRSALKFERRARVESEGDKAKVIIRMPAKLARQLRIAAAVNDRTLRDEILARIRDTEGAPISTTRCPFVAENPVIGFRMDLVEFFEIERQAKAVGRSAVVEMLSRLAFSMRAAGSKYVKSRAV